MMDKTSAYISRSNNKGVNFQLSDCCLADGNPF